MTKKIKQEELKVPVPAINKILSVRKLTDKEVAKLINSLKKLVKDSSKNNLDIIAYVTMIVMNLLTASQFVELSKELKGKEKDANQFILASIYNAVVEYYPGLRIEYICGDVNGLIPEEDPMEGQDPNFQNFVEKEIKKAKVEPKKKKFEFNTIADIEALKEAMKLKVKGQNEAIETICEAIKLKAVGFSKNISLFFIGPTGVGKSFISTILGEKFSGNFFKIDCAEFMSGHEQHKLLGSPPGYIGSNDKPILKDKADRSNRWILLFDEIEKASDKFLNLLLGLMDTGKLTDNQGHILDFTDSIFIFTSNCGVKDIKTETTGFTPLIQNGAATKEDLEHAIKRQFSPEFRNRIDEFVFFNAITPEIAKEIVESKLKELPVMRTEELINFISTNGFSKEMGARELNRFIKKNVAVKLADAMLSGRMPSDKSKKYEMVIVDGKLTLINTVATTST